MTRSRESLLPIGKSVSLTQDAVRMFPRLSGVKGTVVAHSREGLPKVRFHGRSTITIWHPHLLIVHQEGTP